MRYVIFILLSVFMMNGCSNNEKCFSEQEVFYNNRSRVVNEYAEKVYYIKNSQLCCGIEKNEIIADDVRLFHVYDELYYVKKVDDLNFLYKYDGTEHTEIAVLPEGLSVHNFSIIGNTIYVQVDSSLFVKDFSVSEFSKLEFEDANIFMENNGYIYYQDGEIIGDDQLKLLLPDYSKVKLIHRLNEYNIAENEYNCIAENELGFILTPVCGGIVYFNVENHRTILYKDNKKKTLMRNNIDCLYSDGNSIIYNDLTNKGVYKMFVDSGKVEKLYNENVSFLAIVNDYLYTRDEEFIKIE